MRLGQRYFYRIFFGIALLIFLMGIVKEQKIDDDFKIAAEKITLIKNQVYVSYKTFVKPVISMWGRYEKQAVDL